MAILAFDLGGTKLATAVFNRDGDLLMQESVALGKMKGDEVGVLIATQIEKWLKAHHSTEHEISSIGICIPGIIYRKRGTVWAPNISGWEDYPLLQQMQDAAGNIPVVIDNDRACYIMGECWKGSAQSCPNAIFMAVGTGIGAGILVDGRILRGVADIAGAIGWMALPMPPGSKDIGWRSFEHNASGEGIVKLTRQILSENAQYKGMFRDENSVKLTTAAVFNAYEDGDAVAIEVLNRCVEYWGMAIANLVSFFNPEKIILGGGVFGPAIKFIPAIRHEAKKWAQPISMQHTTIEASSLNGRAGLFGAAWQALQNSQQTRMGL